MLALRFGQAVNPSLIINLSTLTSTSRSQPIHLPKAIESDKFFRSTTQGLSC